MNGRGNKSPTKVLWKEFGAWIQRERELAGLKQDQVAAKVGIHPVQLSRIENGESGTKRDTVIALACAIDINEAEALQRAGFASPTEAAKPNGYDESEFALLHSRVKKLTPQQKRDFYIFWNAAERYVAEKERENQQNNGNDEG
ncbi:MAG TPA: helix-turn-helix transcriptional regulator [Pyrinomonadaceae bacterium]|jgi:transcriptional regulator with XRE-family HTH domain